MTEKPVFNAKGYLEKSYLDKEGAKHITFELSAESALEIAKLELMGRDLINHRPVLLELHIEQSLMQDLPNARRNKKTQTIR